MDSLLKTSKILQVVTFKIFKKKANYTIHIDYLLDTSTFLLKIQQKVHYNIHMESLLKTSNFL